MDILKSIGRKKRPSLMRDPLTYQAMIDNAPTGSVGAPSGIMPNPYTATQHDPVQSLLDASTMAPIVGDIMGPIADIRRFQQHPETRTLGNALMFGLGVLPAIPSLAYLMDRGGDAARRITPFSKEAGIIGYHGSPHKFDAFDMSKIGTGEGAQAYGHGLYFAESPDVAQQYRRNLSERAMQAPDGKKIAVDDDGWVVNVLDENGGDFNKAREAMAEHGKMYPWPAEVATNRLNEWEKAGYKLPSRGSLYTVDIPDEHIDKMLDWDKPLSEQPETVRNALMQDPNLAEAVARIEAQRIALNESSPGRLTHPVLGKLAAKQKTVDSMKGEQVMAELSRSMGGQAAVSEYLRSLGIPGIKYLDAGSRGAGTGTRNFVLFDDKIPKIINRE